MNPEKGSFYQTVAGACLLAVLAATGHAETKVLLCTGDYGMWAQERAALIRTAVNAAAPQAAAFEVEQSFNFVKKLEAPGYAERFDVVVCGDIALGQMTTAAQKALVRFVERGGGLIYVVRAKSTIPFDGPREAEPLPLADVLPYRFPACDPIADAREDAVALHHDNALFEGLDFAGTPLLAAGKDGRAPDPVPPLALERAHGRGKVTALFGAFGASYKYLAYATFEKSPGGWDEWPAFGQLWVRLLRRAAAASPVLDRSRAELDSGIRNVPCEVKVAVDATRPIDDIRAGVFSVVALQQLYNEDGGAGEEQFLELNPRDWLDRRTQEVLPNTVGKFPDKPAMFRQYNIRGIIMGNNSYGSYGQWDEATFASEVKSYVDAARQYPDILTFFQPGNEPPCNQGYFAFHNRISDAVLEGAPGLKVIGPGIAWNCRGPHAGELQEFIEHCGARTDVLNWHIYARCPSSVRDEVLYWAKHAAGRLRSGGPVRVMFTEADAWNTRESQFNYLLDRAFTFLPMQEVVACFQYCMRPRTEGGTYWFGVLMDPPPAHVKPAGEFAANYNGYWVFRNLRGKRVDAKLTTSPAAAAPHCRAIASSADDGNAVTVVAYYDTGYFSGLERSEQASFTLDVQLPPGRYRLTRSDCAWNSRRVEESAAPAEGEATVSLTLRPCTAAAFTWTRTSD
jgi:hypothetical protein